MRLPGVSLFLIAAFSLSGCVGSSQSSRPPTKSTVGFWFWHGSSAEATWSSESLEVLFLHAGTIRKAGGTRAHEQWQVFGELPDRLPAAREYWLVFRFEQQGVPGLPAASLLAREALRLQEAARRRHLKVAGVQLDIDSPSGALSQYAAFLRDVRKDMPP